MIGAGLSLVPVRQHPAHNTRRRPQWTAAATTIETHAAVLLREMAGTRAVAATEALVAPRAAAAAAATRAKEAIAVIGVTPGVGPAARVPG